MIAQLRYKLAYLVLRIGFRLIPDPFVRWYLQDAQATAASLIIYEDVSDDELSREH